MQLGPRVGLMVLALMTTPGATSVHRLIIVVSQAADPRAAKQHALLTNDAAAMRERDVIVQDITPEAARRDRPELGVNSRAAFEVLLVGKDGGIKLRRDKPVSASEIIALIDAMPMRQDEMRRR